MEERKKERKKRIINSRVLCIVSDLMKKILGNRPKIDEKLVIRLLSVSAPRLLRKKFENEGQLILINIMEFRIQLNS